MIDISPLLEASNRCEDLQEKQVLRFLGEQAAEDRPYPRRLYKSGEARESLSPSRFVAFEKVMTSVYDERKRLEAAGYDVGFARSSSKRHRSAPPFPGYKRVRRTIVRGAKLLSHSSSEDEEKNEDGCEVS